MSLADLLAGAANGALNATQNAYNMQRQNAMQAGEFAMQNGDVTGAQNALGKLPGFQGVNWDAIQQANQRKIAEQQSQTDYLQAHAQMMKGMSDFEKQRAIPQMYDQLGSLVQSGVMSPHDATTAIRQVVPNAGMYQALVTQTVPGQNGKPVTMTPLDANENPTYSTQYRDVFQAPAQSTAAKLTPVSMGTRGTAMVDPSGKIVTTIPYAQPAPQQTSTPYGFMTDPGTGHLIRVNSSTGEAQDMGVGSPKPQAAQAQPKPMSAGQVWDVVMKRYPLTMQEKASGQRDAQMDLVRGQFAQKLQQTASGQPSALDRLIAAYNKNKQPQQQ